MTKVAIRHAKLTMLSLALTSAGFPSKAVAEPDSVYEGAPVVLDRAENGALMNRNLVHHQFMRHDPRLVKVRDKVWSITGYSLANCSFVETPEGIVVFDSGNNVGQGEYFLAQIRSVTKKPIIAVIYSHLHYINGTSAFVEDPKRPPMIIGHPLLANKAPGDLSLARARARRADMQFGAYLPMEGDDARATTPEPHYDDPALRKSGFMPVTKPIKDGETVDIGGLSFTFMWTTADTKDSLTVWIPQLDTVLTNTVAVMFYPLYTLRGEIYRDPQEIIESYDRVRALHAEYYVPVHGVPITGERKVDHILTLHRDAYAFTYDQALRAINLGWTPDQMVERIKLPQRFLDEPSLYEVYSEFPYALRGIYRGLMGWFDEDTTELNPPTPHDLGSEIVAGFGGSDALLSASRKALTDKRYNLAASLAKFAVDADPENKAARQTLADALRQLARVSKGMQSYNFYMTQVLALEGKVDRFAPPATPVFAFPNSENLARLPARSLVELLESTIDPKASSGLYQTYAVEFTDTNEIFRVAIRDGVAEVTDQAALESDKSVKTTRAEWAQMITAPIQNAPAICTANPELCRMLAFFAPSP